MLFHKIEGGQAITHRRGVYKQVDVYHYQGLLFVAHGGGFVRLLKSGTSVPDLALMSLVNVRGKVVDHLKRASIGSIAYVEADWT